MITTLDYTVGRPFRTQMIKRGVPEGELDGPGYTQVCWSNPGRGGAAEDGARARARTEGTDARERADAGGAAEVRKRGALAAQVPSPRGMEGRKRVVRSASPSGRGREAEAAEAEE